MTENQFIALMVVATSAIWLLVFYLQKKDSESAKKWAIVREGTYDFVGYGADVYRKRSGAMAHTTTETKHPFTAIYFKDGSAYVCNGQRISVDSPTGTEITIWRNGLGKHKISPKEKTSL